jgi:phosphate transport system substrate-binding protein
LRFHERRIARLLALLLALTLVAAACGGDDDDDTADAGDSTESDGGSDVAGDVIVSGSSTVEPISIRVAELLEDSAPDVLVDVDGPGTGDGFKLFCGGETDISDASRPIKEEEAAVCEENGIEFIELKVAFDGISVLTSPANDAIECLTFEDLYALIGPESESVGSWSDAQELATELGSSTELPDAPLDLTGPGEESGTYDSFIEIAFKSIAEGRVESGAITEDQATTTRPDYQSTPDDTVIISNIEGSDSSLGWVGFAYAEEAADQVKELEVDGGDGCVAPSADTIADGSYPLSRGLYIYVNAANAEENPAIAAYIDFYLGEGLSAVEEVGYVSLPDDQLAESASAWEARTTGTREG